MKPRVVLVLALAAACSPQEDYRLVDGTDSVLWLGGHDDLIRCSHAVSRDLLGASVSSQLEGVRVEVKDTYEVCPGRIGECSGRDIRVGFAMDALLHEYLEHFLPWWHASGGTELSSGLEAMSNRYRVRQAQECQRRYLRH